MNATKACLACGAKRTRLPHPYKWFMRNMLTEKQIENFFNIPVSQASDRNAKLLFSDPENVRGLLQIVADELVENINFSRITQIKQSYIAETLREVESDIVLQVPFEMDGKTDDLLIYI